MYLYLVPIDCAASSLLYCTMETAQAQNSQATSGLEQSEHAEREE